MLSNKNEGLFLYGYRGNTDFRYLSTAFPLMLSSAVCKSLCEPKEFSSGGYNQRSFYLEAIQS